MATKKCMKCGGSMKKYQNGGSTKKSTTKYLPSKSAYDKSISDMGGPDNPPKPSPIKPGFDVGHSKKSPVNKPVKKYANGGSTMKTSVGSKNANSFIAGIPNNGPTGNNYQGVDTMKKGGMVKKKYQNGGSTKTSVYNGAYGKSVSVENTKTGSKTLVDKSSSIDDRSKVTKYKDVTHVGKDGKTYKTSVAKSDTGKKITNETPKMKFSATSGVNGKSASTTSKKTGTSTFVTTDKKTGDKKVLVTTKDGKSYSKNVKMAKGGSTGFGMLSVKAGVDNNPRATAADRIAGAKKKAKFGASVPVQHSPAPGRVRSSSGVGTVAVGARKKMGGSIKKKK